MLIKNNDLSILPQKYFEEILAHDVLEHIPRAFTMSALLDWAALLKNGGILTLQTSDILGIANLMKKNNTFEFQYNWSSCLFGNQQHPGDFHHNGFTEKTLRVYLECAGFSVPKFEWSDGWLIATNAIKVNDWLAILDNSKSDLEVISSSYETFFKRTLDKNAEEHWNSLLRKGKSRRDIVKQIASSSEHLYVKAKELLL